MPSSLVTFLHGGKKVTYTPYSSRKRDSGRNRCPFLAISLLDDPDADDAGDLLQILHKLLGGGRVQIQHGVGVLAAGAVEHVGNVDIVLGEHLGELGQHVGDVLMQNGDTAGLVGIAHVAIGEVNGVDEVGVYGDFFYLEALARYLLGDEFIRYW